MKVLYIHHAGPFGGASRSLLELLLAIPNNEVNKYVLTKRGQFGSILKTAGIEVLTCPGISQFDNTRYSHYRGLRWLVLLRELYYLPSTLFSLIRAKRKWGDFDLIHINDITLVPSMYFAKIIFGCPVVVHVRSVQQPFNNSRGKLLRRFFLKFVDIFVAIDNTVAKSLDQTFNIKIIHNGLKVNDEFINVKKTGHVFTVGMVGAISKAKGCLDLVDAANLCKKAGVNIRFIFIGKSSRRKSSLRDFFLRIVGVSQEIEDQLINNIKKYGLSENVEFWPFTLNLSEVYRKLDLVCFPSHFDAPGRPIFEAAFYGVPSVAAISNPTADTFLNNKTGILVNPHDISALSAAIMKFANDRSFLIRAGENARELANKYYDINKNANRMVGVYSKLFRKISSV